MSEIIVKQEALKKLMGLQYKFHSVSQKMEHMSPQIQAEFTELQEAVRELFQPHREQEDKADALRREMLDKIEEEHGFKTIWSVPKIDDMNAIFGYVESVEYLGCIEIIGKEVTWVELWATADRLIKQSGDFHHIFIENFAKKPTEISHRLITGS